MNKLNALQCGTSLKNTGACDCFFDPKLIVGGILIPKNRVLTQAELNDIQATLEGLAEDDSKSLRIFPVQKFVAITDASEEPTFQTFGYGTQIPVREGKYNWTFQFVEGGVQLSNGLRSFNGLSSKYAIIWIESNNTLIGTVRKDADGKDGLAGVPQEGGYPYTYPWKANDGTNVTSYRFQSVFQPSYVNENIAFVRIPVTDYLLTELNGLQDVEITVEEVDGAVLTVTAQTACGQDMFEDFADALANEEAWVAKDENGEAVVISSVTKNEDVGGWDITWAAPIADGSTINLAAPSVLAVAPVSISGYEGVEETIEVGS